MAAIKVPTKNKKKYMMLGVLFRRGFCNDGGDPRNVSEFYFSATVRTLAATTATSPKGISTFQHTFMT